MGDKARGWAILVSYLLFVTPLIFLPSLIFGCGQMLLGKRMRQQAKIYLRRTVNRWLEGYRLALSLT